MTVGGGVTISFGLTSSTTPAGPSLGVGSAVHILSQKVSRALELRTDTPTMTSALEALASLSSSSSAHYDNTSCNPQQARTGIVDSKLVRSIMEKDALNQALLYQSQLESLLRSVADMKSSLPVPLLLLRQFKVLLRWMCAMFQEQESHLINRH